MSATLDNDKDHNLKTFHGLESTPQSRYLHAGMSNQNGIKAMLEIFFAFKQVTAAAY